MTLGRAVGRRLALAVARASLKAANRAAQILYGADASKRDLVERADGTVSFTRRTGSAD